MATICHRQFIGNRAPAYGRRTACLAKLLFKTATAARLERTIILSLMLMLNLLAARVIAAPLESTNGTGPVQAIRFKMPKSVPTGADRLRLVCDYDLLGQTMHAMKLFKDNKEFYRYTPDERKLAFPVFGVNVDLDRSNAHEVWLKRVDRRTAGDYRCEVSVEETFRSMSMARSLEVRSSPPISDTAKQIPQHHQRRTNQRPPGASDINSPSRAQIDQAQQAARGQASSSGAANNQPALIQMHSWLPLLLLAILLQIGASM